MTHPDQLALDRTHELHGELPGSGNQERIDLVRLRTEKLCHDLHDLTGISKVTVSCWLSALLTDRLRTSGSRRWLPSCYDLVVHAVPCVPCHAHRRFAWHWRRVADNRIRDPAVKQRIAPCVGTPTLIGGLTMRFPPPKSAERATARMLGRRSMKITRLENAYCAVRLGTPW